jgi:hypothetical protein
MRLVQKSYADLQDSQYLAMALLLKFILGGKKHGCNLLNEEVCSIATAELVGGSWFYLGGRILLGQIGFYSFTCAGWLPEFVRVRHAGGGYRP